MLDFKEKNSGVYQIIPVGRKGYMNLIPSKKELIIMKGNNACFSPSHIPIDTYEMWITNNDSFGKAEWNQFKSQYKDFYNNMML